MHRAWVVTHLLVPQPGGMLVQPDGGLIVAADMHERVGTTDVAPGQTLVRITPSGALDSGWTAPRLERFEAAAGAPDGSLYVAARWIEPRDPAQASGRVLARLEPSTGAMDPDFRPFADEGWIDALVAAGDWLYVAGQFSGRYRMLRISSATGQVDPAWAPAVGYFVNVWSTGLARVYAASGVLDTSWSPGLEEEGGDGLALSPDGAWVYTRAYFATDRQVRFLTSDGALDPAWRSRPFGRVLALATSPQGLLLVGGEFSYVDDDSHRRHGLVAITDAPESNPSTYPRRTGGSRPRPPMHGPRKPGLPVPSPSPRIVDPGAAGGYP